jgi:hypothetical protein
VIIDEIVGVVAEGGCGCWMDVVSLYNSFPRGQANTSMRLHISPHLYALGKTERTPPPHTSDCAVGSSDMEHVHVSSTRIA